jgi:flagellum-specific peptidoglycan hydrolase FlgJ
VHSVRKPWWQQATALVTVSTGGVITGFTFVPGAAATITSPSSVPMHLLALEKAAKPADTGDDRLRPAIVNVAGYYLKLAQTRTPAQMEALIWGKDSLDGADHGESCAAFASLTLELAAQAVGQQSWVSGGSTYPWPLHQWADVRVNPNQDSLGITSIVQDAQAHQRWHPLGDGYQPQPGDWVVFDGHVEVVTSYANGVLDTIGADSLPNLTVNAHAFPDPLAQQGVEGFVDNGHLGEAAAASAGGPAGAAAPRAPAPGNNSSRVARPSGQSQPADIPGIVSPTAGGGAASTGGGATSAAGAGAPARSTLPGGSARADADIPGSAVAAGMAVTAPQASATGSAKSASPRHPAAPYKQHTPPATATPGTKSQQAFINQIAPGAIAAQQRFGVPAAVTIAQAIDESGWGTSQLSAQDYNLFGIKGSGPAGSVTLPTQEFENGQWVTIYAQFRVYHNISESISDHAELLATSGYYTRAMADRAVPDAFANDLTGVYATDPDYGSNLIALMRLYNLYRFDSPSAGQAHATAPGPAPSHSEAAHPAGAQTPGTEPSIPGVISALAPGLAGTAAPSGRTAAAQPSGAHQATARQSQSQAPIPGILPPLSPAHAGTPTTSVAQTPAAPPSATQAPAAHAPAAAGPGTAAVPGVSTAVAGIGASGAGAAVRDAVRPGSTAAAPAPPARRRTAGAQARGAARVPGVVAPAAIRYQTPLPATVATAFFARAKGPLGRAEQLHRDVAGQAGIRWQLLAACDWMQCRADHLLSPVHGERLGSLNADGTVYRTKSQALAQCASDLIYLAGAVYGLDLTARRALPVRALADVFAAFRWGALLTRHGVSAMEFPYSVAGLTEQHLKMHWPVIGEPDAPDKPGSKFRGPFGAVPVLLSLNYPALV